MQLIIQVDCPLRTYMREIIQEIEFTTFALLHMVTQVIAGILCVLAVGLDIHSSWSNAAGSSIAIWLSIFRFSKMPAFERPLMKRL